MIFFFLQYAERFVTDVRMRAHNAAEAVYYSLPEMPQLPKLPQLHNLQENVLLQMQNVRSTAVASAHDAYAILQVFLFSFFAKKFSGIFLFFCESKSSQVNIHAERLLDKLIYANALGHNMILEADLRFGKL